MTAVELGQQSSQAVGPGLCRAKYFYDLSLTFSIPEISETLKDSFTKFFGTVRQKILTENRDTPSLAPPPPYP